MALPVICSNCGNDEATEGYGWCMDCLEEEEAQRLAHNSLSAGHDLHPGGVALGEV